MRNLNLVQLKFVKFSVHPNLVILPVIVRSGTIKRSTKARLIRDGVVVADNF